jgi:enoyl-CoA hydratase
MLETLRTEAREGVFVITLNRPSEYNTITPRLSKELAAAIDAADASQERVILLRAEGRAFCAGHALAEGTAAQAAGDDLGGDPNRVWDSVADLDGLQRFEDTFQKLWLARKPVIAAVQGWCIGGGTDLVLYADIIVAAENARFGYPPARVWGVPITPMWIYRMGLERAKRYLLTGDELSAREAEKHGLILEVHPDDELDERSFALARRMAQLPASQLIMLKLWCNQAVENMGFHSSVRLGMIFDGVARHTQEGLDFVEKANRVGFRQAVRERDDPFGDYGSRPKPR